MNCWAACRLPQVLSVNDGNRRGCGIESLKEPSIDPYTASFLVPSSIPFKCGTVRERGYAAELTEMVINELGVPAIDAVTFS